MFDERQDGIEHAVEIVTDWLDGNENPLTWNPPVYAGLWIWCLAHNLATAGSLCAAENNGWLVGYNQASRLFVKHIETHDCRPNPGCGRAAGER